MEETKEQHIVPSAYLKRFTFDEDKGRNTKIFFLILIISIMELQIQTICLKKETFMILKN